jgi:outer membrane autotransporter protein
VGKIGAAHVCVGLCVHRTRAFRYNCNGAVRRCGRRRGRRFGGAGGAASALGTGATGGATNTGSLTGFTGGGGGGAGTTGGAGGIGTGGNLGGTGGAAGTNGGDGGSSTNEAPGGGGGGGHGVSIATTISNSAAVSGGQGGAGGAGVTTTGQTMGGGGGGGGGYGAVMTTPSITYSNNSTITGGAGEAGGFGTTGGGNGGAGVSASSGALIVNTGTITGGTGGTGGGGSAILGAAGAGGVGIIGSALTITNSGMIAGGLSEGGTRANAITFTSGINQLTLMPGSAFTGNVVAIGGATLTVTGSGTGAPSMVVQAATLTGTGTVGATMVTSGGTFAPGTVNTPGTSMTVSGTLSLATGSTYQVYVSPAASTMATVSSTATLRGTVAATFTSGSYLQNSYTILHAAGLGGTTFSTLTTSNLPPGFTASLGYSATNVSLNVTAVLGQTLSSGSSSSSGGTTSSPTGGTTPADTTPVVTSSSPSTVSYASALNGNQFGVATAINTFFNSGGALPPAFVSLFAPTGNNLTQALSQLSGEPMTGGRIAGATLTSGFLGTILDSSSTVDPSNRASIAAAASAPSDACETCDGEPVPAPRWSARTSGFGGVGYTNGNASVGSSSVTANTYGFAAGLDFNYSNEMQFGVSVSSGGSNWWTGGGLGSGTSVTAQLGLSAVLRQGPAYLGLAAAFANHRMTTNRMAVGDALAATFDAQSYGGRAEAGYRFDMRDKTVGVTPYGAVQFQLFHMPGYSETDLTGLGFNLAYGSSNATYTRTEIGTRLDSHVDVAGKPLTLRGRLAWAHDFISSPAVTASFVALPGSSFMVNGTTPATDAALVSVSGEYAIAEQVTVGAKFGGEFSGQAQTCGAMASLRYSW